MTLRQITMTIVTLAFFAAPAAAAELRGHAGDKVRFGSCTGILTSVALDHSDDPSFYEITRRGQPTCNLGFEGAPFMMEVLEACTVGHSCRVTGKADDCEGADCTEFIKITAVRAVH